MNVTRVRYRERAPLRQSDLEDEQAYRIAMRRRHNIGQHGWGIVCGLELSRAHDQLRVQPGMAIDGYGRELLVLEAIAIPAETFDQFGGNVDSIDVWLIYAREPVAARGEASCGPLPRYQERALLRVEPARGDNPPDPRQPELVPEEDWAYAPHAIPPDDSTAVWPVYLGRAKRNAGEGPAYELIPEPLPYVTLRGELVVSPPAHGPQPPPEPPAGDAGQPEQAKPPTNRVRMQVGAELATDRRRFAVALPDASGAYVDRLAINADGSTQLGGPATLGKQIPGKPNDLSQNPTLTLAGGHGAAIRFRPLQEPPKAAAPWQLYHVKITKDGVETHELRLEIANPGKQGDPARNLFVVGRREGNTFVPCLSVAANGTVTVNDVDLFEGQVVEKPIDADPNDPRFGAKLAEGLSQGLPVSSNIAIEITAPKTATEGGSLTYQIKLTNTTTTQMTDVQVLANQRVANLNTRVLEALHGQPLTLDPGASVAIDADNLAKLAVNPVPNDPSRDIRLVVSAVGRLGASGSAFGSASSVVQIVAK